MTEFFSNFAFAQMLFCAVLLFPQAKKNHSIFLFVLLMLSGCGYLLTSVFPSISQYELLWWVGLVGSNALPGVFWLVSLSIFSDRTDLKKWQYGVASLTLIIPLCTAIFEVLLSVSIKDHTLLAMVIKKGALCLELVLITHALYCAINQWRDDLVQERRYMRGAVISLSALYIIFVMIIDQLLQIQWSALDTFTGLVLAVLVTSINLILFQLREPSLFADANPTVIPEGAKPKAFSKELVQITDAMEKEKLYQKEGLTIAVLAKHLGIHEYKLRNLINGELNYRNFNDFLNHYRIKEVTHNLITEEFSSTPVLTLALESGFRSLSSFNKAFKSTHGITPTEYRKKHQIT